MPRLFIGIEIPAAVASELEDISGDLDGAHWIDADDFHVTLRFVGDIGRADAEELHSALGSIARRSFQLSVGSLDAFGGDRPRAIFAAVQSTSALSDLQADIERLCRRLGFAPETRKFVPHVTLARLRRISSTEVARFLSANGYRPSTTFPVTRFSLFSARDSVGGGPYIVEAFYPLGV